jgi:hypothetical protein
MRERLREQWLNGWVRMPLDPTSVLIGTVVHCVGCGKARGMISVVMSENEILPDKLPDWPFDEIMCPVHASLK